MSQLHLTAVPPRRRAWGGVIAASAVLAGLLSSSLPAQAQINGWMNQMNPWGPTYNQHSAPNIMTPRMNYTPPVTIPQTQRQFEGQFGPSQNRFPQVGYPGGSPYPQGPSGYGSYPSYQSYPSYPPYYGQGAGNQYQNQGPTFYPAGPSPAQRRRPPVTTRPPTSTTQTGTGPGGTKVTITRSAPGPSYTLPSSNIQIHGIDIAGPFGYQNNFPYGPIRNNTAPAFLGGYYYGNYTDKCYPGGSYFPSVYSVYGGLPQYLYNVGTGLSIAADPYYPVYTTSYLPFSDSSGQVTYNQNNYQTNYQTNNQYNYYAAGDGQAKTAGASVEVHSSVPADSYQAAFGDIEKAWKNGDLNLLKSHIRDSDTRISVYFKGKYSYSIASGDFVQITRDAFDRLHTSTFEFTRLRKAKNGDVTAYGKQVYRTSAAASGGADDLVTKDDTVPFRTDGTAADDGQPYDRASDPTGSQTKTVYVSYILRRYDDQWDIIGIDTSPTELAK